MERISREHGANSVSDFVRRVLTSSGFSILDDEPITRGVQAQVDALQRQVDWLASLIQPGRGEGGPYANGPTPGAAAVMGSIDPIPVRVGSASSGSVQDA